MEDIAVKKLVLLVDDTPASIQVIRNIQTYTTRIVTNGSKVLEHAEKSPAPTIFFSAALA